MAVGIVETFLNKHSRFTQVSLLRCLPTKSVLSMESIDFTIVPAYICWIYSHPLPKSVKYTAILYSYLLNISPLLSYICGKYHHPLPKFVEDSAIPHSYPLNVRSTLSYICWIYRHLLLISVEYAALTSP